MHNLQEDKREYAVKWKEYEGITVEPYQNLNEHALNSFHKYRDVGVRATLSEVGILQAKGSSWYQMCLPQSMV